jgi:putative transposase
MRLPGDHESRSKGTGQKRWSNRWKAALNAFEITFDGRLSAGRK